MEKSGAVVVKAESRVGVHDNGCHDVIGRSRDVRVIRGNEEGSVVVFVAESSSVGLLLLLLLRPKLFCFIKNNDI